MLIPIYEVTFIYGLTNNLKLIKWIRMTAHSNVFSNNEESGRGFFPATKAIIETYVVEKSDYNYSKRIIENNAIIVHYTTEKISNLTLT